MQQPSSPMRAAIDIGSNTIHIVIARATTNDLAIVADEVDLVRIGASVTASRAISPQKCQQAIATLHQYKTLAEQHGAEQIIVVATEAIRQARNSTEFLAKVQRETGLTVHLISGDIEATLTFYGATYETNKQANPPAQLAVMDLGGGSMELVTATNMHISWRTSIPIGSGWLHDRYLPSDPPTPDDLSVAHTFLHTYFQGIHLKQLPPMLIVTGGSANSLLFLAQRAFRLPASTNHLTYNNLMHCEGLLSALAAEEISQRYEQPVARARILPAGAMIIREIMSRLHLNEITVSPHGIREGLLLAYQRYGEHWLEQLRQEAELSNQTTNGKHGTPSLDAQHETFIQSAQRMLHERVNKLLDWREEVLKHEDIENVHKMRVASRRLRATLDAYISCCKPAQFKKAYRRVKVIADMLGNARDTDVLLQGLYETYTQAPQAERPGIQWLIDRLTLYRQQKQQELEAFFATFDEDDFKQQIESCIQKGAEQ